MAAAFAIRVEGLEALDRRLRELPPKIERKVLRTALRGTANKVATRLKAATPRRTGATASKVRVQARVNKVEGAFAKVSYRGRPAPPAATTLLPGRCFRLGRAGNARAA